MPEVLKYEPDSFESYDDHTFQLAVKYFPEFATQMKSGLFALGITIFARALDDTDRRRAETRAFG